MTRASSSLGLHRVLTDVQLPASQAFEFPVRFPSFEGGLQILGCIWLWRASPFQRKDLVPRIKRFPRVSDPRTPRGGEGGVAKKKGKNKIGDWQASEPRLSPLSPVLCLSAPSCEARTLF